MSEPTTKEEADAALAEAARKAGVSENEIADVVARTNKRLTDTVQGRLAAIAKAAKEKGVDISDPTIAFLVEGIATVSAIVDLSVADLWAALDDMKKRNRPSPELLAKIAELRGKLEPKKEPAPSKEPAE